jgi:hypothetical protein
MVILSKRLIGVLYGIPKEIRKNLVVKVPTRVGEWNKFMALEIKILKCLTNQTECLIYDGQVPPDIIAYVVVILPNEETHGNTIELCLRTRGKKYYEIKKSLPAGSVYMVACKNADSNAKCNRNAVKCPLHCESHKLTFQNTRY